MTKLGFATLCCLAACGGDEGNAIDASAGADAAGDAAGTIDASGDPDAAPGTFTLTSPAFTEGGVIPDENACAGANVSPALAWTAGPAGTLGYAVVLTDLTNPLVHSVIYDIPGAGLGLPADVDKDYAPADVPGAHQTRAYDNTTFGYLGPCPGSTHTYRFDAYALDVATLPGATMNTSRTAAVAAIQMHDLGMASLSGTFTP
jgi:phosphatidylethanolamine-binding protein (PEBP) family uncharacterized protein